MPVFVWLIVVVVPPICGLLAWLAYLRLVKHVFDQHGPDAVKDALPRAARAFPRPRQVHLLLGRRRAGFEHTREQSDARSP